VALEKRLEAIPPQSFTADGTINGLITVADATEYKVKQQVFLSASTLPDLDQIEIRRVINAGHGVNATQLYVGPKGGSIDARTDVSAYTVALGAAITANEQNRPSIPNESINRAVYEEEPTVALRVFPVDEMGNDYNADNPFPVAAVFDGDVKVGDIRITACDNDPKVGDVHSSVRIGGIDCANEMDVNPDGSINVNIINSTGLPGLIVTHNEITSVPASVETIIVTVTAPAGGYRVEKVEVSGENVALFRVYVGVTVISDKRSWWTNFNQTFDFENFPNGLILTSGQVLKVTCFHTRPYLGNFESTVLALAI
jgi:hypothetical protein